MMKVRDLLKAIRNAGGEEIRTRGSHQTWRLGNKTIIVVVNHKNDDAYKECVKNAIKAGVPGLRL